MESMGAFFDEEFDSSSKMFFSHEDADLMFQLNGEGNLVIPNESIAGSFLAAAPSIFWPSNEGNNENVAANDFLDYTNLYNICQESSNSTTSASEGVFVNASQEFDHQTNYDYINLLQVTNDHHSTDDQAMDFCLMDQTNIAVYPNNVVEDIIITCPRDGEMENPQKGNAEIQKPANVADSENEMLRKRKVQTEAEEKTIDESSPNPKKKSRVSRNAPKAKRNVHPKSKKNEKAKEVSNEEDEPKMSVQNGHSSCSYNSEDDSNASHEESNVGETSDTKAPAALNLSGKARATRGAATDPQSLYARRRRERINERLRILQNIIPNGTKVDISTMLEEAVHYVKFMQLQIKLLSSDDMWMYAPMVHSGFDISLYGKIFPTL